MCVCLYMYIDFSVENGDILTHFDLKSWVKF